MQGQLILKEEISDNHNDYSYDCSNLISGIYFLKIESNEHMLSRKLIIGNY